MKGALPRLFLLAFLLITGFFGSSNLNAQCTGGTLAGSITPIQTWNLIGCVLPGEYYTFQADSGRLYTFSFCFAGGNATWDTQITILDSAGTTTNLTNFFNDDACALQSHLQDFQAPYTGTFRVLITHYNCAAPLATCGTMAFKLEPPIGPGPGTDCANPHVISSLPFNVGGLRTCTYGNDFNSTHACGSNYMNGEDYVFTYSGTAGECISLFTGNTFTWTGIFLLDGCPTSNGTNCIASDESPAGNPSVTNITLPSTGTYYIVVSTWPSPDCTPFDLTVTNCAAVGTGIDCANPFVINSIPYNQFGFTTCGFGDDYDETDACGSNWMTGDDFVFSYTSPGNECVDIFLTNTASWTGFFVLDGCPDSPSTTCITSVTPVNANPRTRYVNFANAGTYYIVVSTYPAPQCTNFDLEIVPCQPSCSLNPGGGASCGIATPITSLDSFCGVSNSSFVANSPGNLDAVFCGSLDNNQWFSFVADSTIVTIDMRVSNCLNALGIQAQVFEVASCNTFTAVSNCWNPLQEANGTLIANGLTVGSTYYLMIDGYAGDVCDFTGVFRNALLLPVEFGALTAQMTGDEAVTLNWDTYSETNNAGFWVQRGFEVESTEDVAIDFVDVGFVEGKGNTTVQQRYSFEDEIAFAGQPYFYRIKQVDFDGYTTFSNIVSVEPQRPAENDLLRLYPNPANEQLRFDYYTIGDQDVRIRLYDITGKWIKDVRFDQAAPGLQSDVLQVGDLGSGIYIYSLQIGNRIFKGRVNIVH